MPGRGPKTDEARAAANRLHDRGGGHGGRTSLVEFPVATNSLCAGLTVVTAISQPEDDYESIKRVEATGGDALRVKYSSEWPERRGAQVTSIAKRRSTRASAELDTRSDRSLAALAQVLAAHPDWSISIEGHTDNVRSDRRPGPQSSRRAGASRCRRLLIDSTEKQT